MGKRQARRGWNGQHGRPVKNTDALANPQALELFRDRKELES